MVAPRLAHACNGQLRWRRKPGTLASLRLPSDPWLAHTPFEVYHGAKGCAHNKVFGQICVVWQPALLQQRVCSHLGRLAARLVLATPCLFNFSETSHTHLRVYQSTSRRLQNQGFAQYSAPAGLVTSLELLLTRGFPSPRWISLPAQVACDV